MGTNASSIPLIHLNWAKIYLKKSTSNSFFKVRVRVSGSEKGLRIW